ncbi:hypothetical protein H261_09347 [Paramagnetospirillum caucaseum]|uniref:Exo-alpha-sialidase n=1 Tax=Paramagnetospirillum caucaseum TaxID=1244869 RepID=M3ABU4_9PROT|nr:sialidase family protein [Paramagnetospirillum caucaseum]EME70253.1 hypothetical protein H261_09347 [Paramagnetospirillum caucaseum]
MTPSLRILIGLLAILWGGAAHAAPSHAGHGGHAAPACADIALRPDCARVATPAFGPDGSLLLAWPAGDRVMVARSPDGGRSLEAPVAIPMPQGVFDMPEGRPALAADSKGRVFLAVTAKQPDSRYAGTLMFASSEDGGRSFAPPRAIATDPASQGFVTMAVGNDDRLTLAWIDKRGAAAAKRENRPYRAVGLMLVWSDDGGRTFSRQDMAADHACECCRIAMTLDRHGQPLVMWRQVFEPNIRDHALISFAAPGRPNPPVKVGEDNWRVDACPHHGPAIAAGRDGAAHAAWFTKGAAGPGLYHAHAADGVHFAPQAPLGNAEHAPAHPQLLSLDGAMWMAWKEFDGTTTRIMGQRSADGGATWGETRTLAETTDSSDHPLLAGNGKRAFLSWLTRREGWRLVELQP